MKVDANDLRPEVRRAVADAQMNEQINRGEIEYEHAFGWKPEDDESCILGNRWLCKGGSCVWVGQSGIGKSALCVQAASRWSAGLDFFGIKPQRQLKSMIIQAENDYGDVFMEIRGVFGSLGWDSTIAEQMRRDRFLTMYRVNDAQAKRGPGCPFIRRLEELIVANRPDIVWLDPLFAFTGEYDIMKAIDMSELIRGKMMPLAEKYGFVWMILHHENKPNKDRVVNAYMGGGSSELTNAMRAVVVLNPRLDGQYDLVFPKRGRQTGIETRTAEGYPCVTIRHAQSSICWEPGNPEMEVEKVKINPWNALESCIYGVPIDRNEWIRRVKEVFRCNQKDAKDAVVSAIVAEKVCTEKDATKYVKIGSDKFRITGMGRDNFTVERIS